MTATHPTTHGRRLPERILSRGAGALAVLAAVFVALAGMAPSAHAVNSPSTDGVASSLRITGQPIVHTFTRAAESVEATWTITADSAMDVDGTLRAEIGRTTALADSLRVEYLNDTRPGRWHPAGTLSQSVSLATATTEALRVGPGAEKTVRIRITLDQLPESTTGELPAVVHATFAASGISTDTGGTAGQTGAESPNGLAKTGLDLSATLGFAAALLLAAGTLLAFARRRSRERAVHERS